MGPEFHEGGEDLPGPLERGRLEQTSEETTGTRGDESWQRKHASTAALRLLNGLHQYSRIV